MGFKDEIQMVSYAVEFGVQRHLVLIGLVVIYKMLLNENSKSRTQL